MTEAPTIDKPPIVVAPYEGIFTEVRAVDGVITWKATISDDGVDKYATRVTSDAHRDFIRNWQAGEPCYLTIAHFYGVSRIGETVNMYQDGRKLKAEGRFYTDSADPFIAKLSQAAADKALAEAPSMPSQRTIKTSIGFNPSAFVTEDLDVIAYTKGVLPEITMTTHAANSRTDFGGQDMTKRALDPEFMQEDAASIIGDEMAAELAARDAALREERAGEPEETLLYRVFSGPDDEALPANVKKLDADKRKVWVKTFNAASKNGASDADAAKTANAFVKNMNAKTKTKVGADEGAPLGEPKGEEGEPGSDSAATNEGAEEERAGRKIQGAKLTKLKEAVSAIQDILAWAEEADMPMDGNMSGTAMSGRALEIRTYLTEPVDAAGPIDQITAQRYMDLTGEESLSALLDYKAMCDYLYTLQYSLQDLLMANLEPESDMMFSQRMANIDQAIDDFKSLVNGVFSQYFSSGGRTIEDGGDNTDMKNDDVKPTDKGTATVKPGGESEGRTARFDEVTAEMRKLIEAGDRDGLQEMLNTDLAPALEEGLGEEPVNEVVAGRLETLEVKFSALDAKIDRLLERATEPAPVTPTTRATPPRRAGFTRPPAEPATRAISRPLTNEPHRFSIKEIAQRGSTTPYP